MILSQISTSLKGPLSSHLTSCYISRFCRSQWEVFSKQQQALCCMYRKESEINPHSRETNQLNVKRKKDANLNYVSQILDHDKKHLDLASSTAFNKCIEILYPQPLSNLIVIYNSVCNELHRRCMSITYTDLVQPAHERMKCTINITWPIIKSFSCVAPSKKAAARNAALMTLNWLYSEKKIKRLKPILYSNEDVQALSKYQKSVVINVEPNWRDEMQNLVDKYNLSIKPALTQARTTDNSEDEITTDDADVIDFDFPVDLSEARNSKLLRNLQQRTNKSNNNLPISNYKKEILDSLELNQVVLIKGDTGCGKSTQVPQFIIDEFTKQGKAHECNVIVSEPRRVAAISLAQRVASERGEMLGDVVGYHVRFDKQLPLLNGSVLFCTTGMLLRRMEHDPNLEGASHVIIDEAHERSLQIDMLLKLFKNLLKKKPHMKLIIMSATVNANLFQQYFSCAVVEVPGKLYPVQMHFLDDIDVFKSNASNNNAANTVVPYENIVRLIKWIIMTKPPGAILCFLPGWQEIKQLHKQLLQVDPHHTLILPLHSKIANKIQQRIFEPAPAGKRKIILATDIAESGITIADINYVIDTAIKRDVIWNKKKSMASLDFTRISRANLVQRKGRAGRVKPGESYHLLTREEYEQLELYPRPEIFKIPLESAVISSQIFSDEKPHEFFNDMPDPPSSTTLSYAIKSLKNLEILDENENLTSLGKRVSRFTLNPKLSKAIILSSVFQCVDPVTSIAVAFSMFANAKISLDEIESFNSMFKEEKLAFHMSSDHIATIKYIDSCLKSNMSDKTLFGAFNDKDHIMNLVTLQKLHLLYKQDLLTAGMVSSADTETANKYANNNELIRAIVFAATNQLIKRNMYGYKNGWYTKNANLLVAEDGEIVKLKTDSVNYNRKEWPSVLMTYIHKMEYVTRRSYLISDSSLLSALSVLLFSREKVQCAAPHSKAANEVLLSVKNLKNVNFSCEKETAVVLLRFREVLWNVVDFIIEHEGEDTQPDNLELVKSFQAELLDVLTKVLTESSNAIK